MLGLAEVGQLKALLKSGSFCARDRALGCARGLWYQQGLLARRLWVRTRRSSAVPPSQLPSALLSLKHQLPGKAHHQDFANWRLAAQGELWD